MNKIIELNPSLIIIIPCYNEAKKLNVSEYQNFIANNHDVLICFVNDGSNDTSLEVLETLKNQFNDNINIINLIQNVGKAEAVRKGMLFCNASYNAKHIAYVDADLSASLEECKLLLKHLTKEICFVFGSRISIVGSQIERKFLRFLIGRIIATFISNILQLKVYDTQCGCKIFTKALSEKIFKDTFISKWLFDVELFQRIILLYGRKKTTEKILEVPLKKWIDHGKSNVKITYFFKLWVDLYKIHKVYKAKIKTASLNTLN